MQSSLPWLGLDPETDKDFEMLLAYKRDREHAKEHEQEINQSKSWFQKLGMVIAGQKLQTTVDEGISMGEALQMSFETMKQQNAVICVLSLSGLLMSLCESELLFSKNQESSALIEGMKTFTTVCSILSCLFTGLWYRLKFDHLKLTNRILKGETFVSSGCARSMAIECIIQLIHAPPGVLFTVNSYAIDLASNQWRGIAYSSDDLFLVMMFLRFYLVFRALMQLSGLQDECADAISLLYQVEIGPLFSIKRLLLSRPVLFIFVTCFICVFTASYWLLIFERGANEQLESMWSCLWLIFTTMSKIGFGDVTPLTMMGRITVVLACCASVFIVVCTILSTFYFINPTNRQEKVIQMLTRVQRKRRLAEFGALTIQKFWRRWNGLVFDARNPGHRVQNEPQTAIDLRRFRKERRVAQKDLSGRYDMLRQEVLDYRNDVTDIQEEFDSRVEVTERMLEVVASKLEKNMDSIDETVIKIEKAVQEIHKNRAIT